MSNYIKIIDKHYIDYIGEISEMDWIKLKKYYKNNKEIIFEMIGSFRSVEFFGYILENGYIELNLKFDNEFDLIKYLIKIQTKNSSNRIISKIGIDRVIKKLDLIEFYI